MYILNPSPYNIVILYFRHITQYILKGKVNPLFRIYNVIVYGVDSYIILYVNVECIGRETRTEALQFPAVVRNLFVNFL